MGRRFFGMLALLSVFAWGQHFQVRNLVSDYEFCLDTMGKNNPQKGTLLAVVSHESGDLIGYATALGESDDENCPTQAIVKNHIQGSLIRPGNKVYMMDVKQADPSIPASFTLLVPDDAGASVRFKPMIFLGPVLGQTAATLAPREWIFGVGIMGLAPRIGTQVDASPLALLTGTPNLGLKLRWFRNEELTVSSYMKGYYYLFKSKASFDFEMILDNYSSTRTASHTKITIKTQRPTKGLFNEEKGKKSITAHLENFYSIMLPRWDRVQIGPRYNITENLLGAYLGYVVMWDALHVMMGAQFENIIKPRSPAWNADLYWRF
jgi:hypothetical protein